MILINSSILQMEDSRSLFMDKEDSFYRVKVLAT